MNQLAIKSFAAKRHVLGHLVLIAVFSVFLSGTSHAASSKRIVQSFEAAELERIDFDISVAELEIEVYDGDSVELDIQLRADGGWWFFGRRDVDDVELEVTEGRDYLDLRLDEDNVEQEWRVRIPAHLAVSMELGVGEIELAGMANDFLLELGVGAVEVITADMDFDSVRIVTGVGDSSVRGFGNSTENERNIVGADSHYFGEGEHRIDIEVGVGDARVIRR